MTIHVQLGDTDTDRGLLFFSAPPIPFKQDKIIEKKLWPFLFLIPNKTKSRRIGDTQKQQPSGCCFREIMKNI